jgi:hypothetical protein
LIYTSGATLNIPDPPQLASVAGSIFHFQK